MTTDDQRNLFRAEAVAAYRAGNIQDEQPPPIPLPRWPMLLLGLLLTAGLVAVATLPLPSFSTAAPSGIRNGAMTAILPGIANPAPRSGVPATLSGPGGAHFDATVTRAAVLRQASELSAWGIGDSTPTPVTVLALRPLDVSLETVQAAGVNKVDVRVSNATAFQRLMGNG